MRILGFLGIFGLLVFNVIGYVIAASNRDWRGIVFMLLMSGLLAFFLLVLWRGRRLERQPLQGQRLAEGWGGESVQDFLFNQVGKSPEGHVPNGG